jgi:peptidoglycan/xylan/chitin deacetylase (PgdA/CDA1 family)
VTETGLPWGQPAVKADGRPAELGYAAWPNGAKLALYVCVGVEDYRFGEGRVEDVLEGGPGAAYVNASWRDYGNRVGGFRLLERLRRFGLPPTVLLNTMVYDTAPDLVKAARAAGAELVAHGVSNSDSVYGLSRAEEASYIQAVADRMRQEEGSSALGWSAPWLELNPWSVELLSAAGFRHLLGLRADDRPVELAGGLLALPYGIELNDSTTMIGRRVDAHAFARMVLDELDELLAAAQVEGPLVMNLVLHTFISGAPFRLHALEAVFERLAALGDRVWLATAGEIAAHHLSAIHPGMGPR